MKDTVTSFIDKLIDWKEFEFFVADIYRESDEIKVEHDVTEIGKSNAKRQIDVKVTQRTKLHTYITIIECKRWKKRVTRQVIDVLFASVEDLNANKGVIFTTIGYEEGAIEYAKSKNIDLFIVRDIRDDEFGEPGRKFSLYLQMFNGKLEKFDVYNPRFFSPSGQQVSVPPPSLQIIFSKNQNFPDEQQLINLNGEKGPNLVKLLIDVRSDLLERTMDSFNYRIHSDDDDAVLVYKTRVKLDFIDYKFKFLKYDSGFIVLDSMYFDFIRSISQSRMDFDRTASVDFALIVENYISNQRNFVSKRKEDNRLSLSDPIVQHEKMDESEVVKDQSIIKVMLEHYVNDNLNPENKIKETEPLTVKLKSEE